MNGAEQFMWFCTRCGHVADSRRPFVKKSLVLDWVANGKIPSLQHIQIVNDYRNLAHCEVCGAAGAELHHWMPQAFSKVVDDISKWPVGYLCKSCHDRWHEAVTPYLPGRGRTKYAQYTKEKYIFLGDTVA
jgi:hypothetical protein